MVSLTLFLPICLEQFARDNGYYEPDHKTPCASAMITAEEARCVVKIGWVWIDTASFRCALILRYMLCVLTCVSVFTQIRYLSRSRL